MATELKTLKDIKDISCQYHFHDDTCYKSDLKQEAIKWINANIATFCFPVKRYEEDSLRISFPQLPAGQEYKKSEIRMTVNLKLFLKFFFNITDEELNDAKRGKHESK